MPILSKTADYYLTYRFIKALTTPFEETKAYELGIIDGEGNILKQMRDLQTTEEKKAYGYFERMMWNLKKIINKIPLLGNRFKSVAVASYFLLKEERGVDPNTTFMRYFPTETNFLISEEAPMNSVSSGNIKGLENDPDGPPVKPRKKKKKKKRRKRLTDFVRR